MHTQRMREIACQNGWGNTYAVYVCRIRMPYTYVLYVCLVCTPYMYALYVCLRHARHSTRHSPIRTPSSDARPSVCERGTCGRIAACHACWP